MAGARTRGHRHTCADGLSHLVLSLLLHLSGVLDLLDELSVLGSEGLVVGLEARELGSASLELGLERLVARDSRLLGQLLVLPVHLGPLVLLPRQFSLHLVQLIVEFGELILIAVVLGLDILHLLPRVRQNDHRVNDLSAQSGEFLVPLFDLLVESLVLNLELLVIDQVETLCELLLLLQDLLLVGETVPQGDVL